MGTNYYMEIQDKPCECCGSEYAETLHMGKSSAGWQYLLRTHPEDGITTLSDWIDKYINNKHDYVKIVDEYGKDCGLEYWLDVVFRGGTKELRRDSALCVLDVSPYYSTSENSFS